MKLNDRRMKVGGALFWVLLICALLGIGYILMNPQSGPEPQPIAKATPAPATPPPATPEPVIVEATPTPTPEPTPVPTPEPTPIPAATPAPLDLAVVGANPRLWPPTISLVQPTSFPLTLDGRVVGQAKAPAGTALRLLAVRGEQVEVEYQRARHLVPVASTDLMARAQTLFEQNGSVIPSAASPQPAATSSLPSLVATQDNRPATGNSARIAQRINVEVVRAKRSRTEGGDWDDKRDRIEMRIKLTNIDTALAANNFRGEIFIFAESILDRSALKLVNNETFDFSLPPRGNHEYTTTEVMTEYDTTGARFGYRYEGWALCLRDSEGKVVLTKSSSPQLLKALEKSSDMSTGRSYKRGTFVPVAEAIR